jgi:hypothetical protein
MCEYARSHYFDLNFLGCYLSLRAVERVVNSNTHPIEQPQAA